MGVLLSHQPCEPTALERALFVAPHCGGLAAALSLPYYEFLLLEAHAEHHLAMGALTEAAANELAMPPPAAETGDDLQAASRAALAREEWYARCEDAQLRVIEEDACFHLPLDDEYGEQLDPPPLYHWRDLAEEVEG